MELRQASSNTRLDETLGDGGDITLDRDGNILTTRLHLGNCILQPLFIEDKTILDVGIDGGGMLLAELAVLLCDSIDALTDTFINIADETAGVTCPVFVGFDTSVLFEIGAEGEDSTIFYNATELDGATVGDVDVVHDFTTIEGAADTNEAIMTYFNLTHECGAVSND